MKNIFNIFLVAVLLFLNSCDDFLDEKSNNRLAVPDKLEDLQALLDDYGEMNQLRTPSVLESYATEMFIPSSLYDALPAVAKLMYKWESVDYFYPNDWSSAYSSVYVANYCLDQLRDIPRNPNNQVLWDQVQGSALFYKAYYYLKLLWAFSQEYDPTGANTGRGIVLRNTSDFNVESQFSSVQDCYDAVISYAVEALQGLPDLPEVAIRPSKWAAHALLARAYISMRLYPEALNHANAGLRINGELINYNKPEDGINIEASAPFERLNKETVFYSEMNRQFIIHLPAYGAVVDTQLFASYHDHDLRREAFFFKSGSYYQFKGTYSHAVNWNFSGLTTAEMYLISAECKAREGNTEGALDDLETLLKHRWDDQFVLDVRSLQNGRDLLDFILEERRKELIMRGLRWSDLKRLNREGRNIVLERMVEGKVYQILPNDPTYVVPLPADLSNFINVNF